MIDHQWIIESVRSGGTSERAAELSARILGEAQPRFRVFWKTKYGAERSVIIVKLRELADMLEGGEGASGERHQN